MERKKTMLGTCLDAVRQQSPLIHNITNYVTVNDVANIILACGASPIMADDPEEVEEITALCGGLNINIGTLNSRTIPSMERAGRVANELKKAVLLDPVGAGASKLRTKTALELMEKIHFDVIRGNMSEIRTLAGESGNSRGVDASDGDAITEQNLLEKAEFAADFSARTGSIIVITGAVDLVTNGKNCYFIHNGRPQMQKITGTGCQLSGLMTAFLAANPEKHFETAAAAVCAMGLAGQTAWNHMEPWDGNATYRNRIIDAVSHMTGGILEEGADYELR